VNKELMKIIVGIKGQLEVLTWEELITNANSKKNKTIQES